MIDFRSDTKTLPTAEMLAAIRQAELGDSKVNEDPTVLRLERMACELLGTESAMLVISGTMANLCALMAHAEPGAAYLTDPDAHIYYYEGGHVAIAGLQPLLVEAQAGVIDPGDLCAAIERHRGRARVLCLENPHNRGGGRALPVERFGELCEIAHSHDMTVHVDGARIFNAAVALNTPAAEFARRADTLMFCLSKSLSCPLGSVLCGRAELIAKAKVVRGRLGGGMRQAGVIAAAGVVALETMLPRLGEDHALARRLAEALDAMPGFSVALETVDTNMVGVNVAETGRTAAEWIQTFEGVGVRVSSYSSDTLRLVTHRHHDAALVEDAIGRMKAAAAAS